MTPTCAPCIGKETQKWVYNTKTKQIQSNGKFGHKITYCLSVPDPVRPSQFIILKECAKTFSVDITNGKKNHDLPIPSSEVWHVEGPNSKSSGRRIRLGQKSKQGDSLCLNLGLKHGKDMATVEICAKDGKEGKKPPIEQRWKFRFTVDSDEICKFYKNC